MQAVKLVNYAICTHKHSLFLYNVQLSRCARNLETSGNIWQLCHLQHYLTVRIVIVKICGHPGKQHVKTGAETECGDYNSPVMLRKISDAFD
jgi:hypothetical protein